MDLVIFMEMCEKGQRSVCVDHGNSKAGTGPKFYSSQCPVQSLKLSSEAGFLPANVLISPEECML